MTPERFQQIAELYHAARGKTGDERAAVLAQTEPELRREKESLHALPASYRFLDRPAVENASELGDSTVTVLMAATQLGPYRIVGKLGEGGMGEVFRATDTRLGRTVAIKTAHERFSARFEREARAISSLNHPNICTLYYDVGPNYLVMELVEGETIAARLKRGPLPVKTAVLYASQIAAALAEAHGKGVIHRDLKPGNIMIAKTGVKVLDFGLAKSSADETVTASHMVMGTPAYMSPEQRLEAKAGGRPFRHLFVRPRPLRNADRSATGVGEETPCVRKTGKNRKPVFARRPGAPLAIRCRTRARAGIGGCGYQPLENCVRGRCDSGVRGRDVFLLPSHPKAYRQRHDRPRRFR